MAVPLVASPPPPVNYDDLITGDSSTFAAGIGGWTATSGAVTRDTTADYRLPNSAASLKWASTTSGASLSLPIPGTFKAGKYYDALVLFTVEETPAGTRGWQWELGIPGTEAGYRGQGTGNTAPPYGGKYTAAWIRFQPASDRTGVTLKLTRTIGDALAETFHVMWAKACRTPPGAGGFKHFRTPFPTLTSDDGDPWVVPEFGNVLFKGWGGSAGDVRGATIGVDHRSAELYSPFWAGFYVNDALDGSTNGDVGMYADHLMADRPYYGVNIEAGEDFIGFYVSERDATHLQLYPDQASNHDVELQDNGTKGWKARDDAGNSTGLLSKSPFRSLAAAPGSPAEGECYYDTVLHKLRVYDGTIWQSAW